MSNNPFIYLDNAATSWPKPEEVYRTMDSFLRAYGANPGRAGFRMAAEAEKIIRETRLLLKDFFHVPKAEGIIFTLNCTDALNIALKGLLDPGDHVITSPLEHNSVARPLNSLKNKGVEYSLVTPTGEGFIDPDEIKRLLRPRTKVVILTHASNVLGTLEPVREIGEICREKGLIFVLDAAQTAGVLPLYLAELKVDLLACPGHKGLYGPTGTGLLIISGNVEIEPFREGGTGSLSEEPFQPPQYPDRLEAGTPNTVGIAALRAGVEFILSRGLAKIREHEVALMENLLEGLQRIPGVKIYGSRKAEERAGLVSFNIQGWDPQEAAAALEAGFNIACRAGLHCSPWAHRFLGTYPAGAIRFGLGFFNTAAEVEKALEAVAALAV